MTGDFNGATSVFDYTHVVNSSRVSTIAGPAYLANHAWDATRDVLTTRDNHFVTAYVYQVNDLGQRTATTYTSPRTWDYDAKGQVVSEQRAGLPSLSSVYLFDGIGNRKKSGTGSTLPGSDNYTVNSLNQYTSALSLSPSHDDDGNLTADGGLNIAGVPRQYEWDGENRLARVKTASSGAITAFYHYDAYGRRLVKTVGTTATISAYDGWNPVAEYTTTGGTPVLARTHLWGTDLSGSLQGAGGVGGLLATRLVGSSATYYPCYDGNGNVTQYVDSSRATVAAYEYGAFGQILATAGALVSSFDIRFSTKPQDPEIGWYYYGYRYYDAYLGRWLNEDPIEEEGGVNLYGFVGNDGVNSSDYLGYQIASDENEDYRNKFQKALELLTGAKLKWTKYDLSARCNNFDEANAWVLDIESEEKVDPAFWKEIKEIIQDKKTIYFVDPEDVKGNRMPNDAGCPCVGASRRFVFDPNTVIPAPVDSGRKNEKGEIIYEPETGATDQTKRNAVTIWHEMIGHGHRGLDHLTNKRGNIQSEVENGYPVDPDPVDRVEDEARKKLGLRLRRPAHWNNKEHRSANR